VSHAQKTRQIESYPAPFLGGWYAIAHKKELPPGKTLAMNIDGEELVVFRSETNPDELGVLDRHCPHLGADLGQGKVCGHTLECAFHKWRFGVDGQVKAIPYTTSALRASLKVRHWHVTNFHGVIMVYVDKDKTRRGQAPPYALRRNPGVDNGSMVLRGRKDAGLVRLHLAELAENSADVAHFQYLHGHMTVPFTQVRVPGVTIHHDVVWFRDETQAEFAGFRDHAVLELFGRRMDVTKATAEVRFMGPGSLMQFSFTIPELGDIVLFQTHTPTEADDPLEHRVRFRWFASPKIPRALVAYVVGSWMSQLAADIHIWAKKRYEPKPMLMPEEGQLLEMRRWYRQFYPEVAAR
jgi:phenylpropionate dioxygenase-like ring-hydroxylating dioxygenase large terminal subunit